MSDVIQDRVSRGLGLAARAMGLPAHAFRPRGAGPALAAANRYLRLPASFQRAPGPRDAPYWVGVFDTAYTRVGDYLAQQGDVYFIVALPRFQPALCVRTNAVVGLRRAVAPDVVGLNPYSGAERVQHQDLLRDWPASVLGLGRAAMPDARLPDDVAGARWTVMLPPMPGVAPRAGDVMRDARGRAGAVTATELTDAGWRLAVTEVRT